MPKKAFIVISGAQILNYAVPLLTFPLLLRGFDIETYGIWIEISTIISLVVTFSMAGLANALGALIVSHPDDSNRIYSNTLYVFVMLALGLLLATYAAAPIINALTTQNPLGLDVLRIACLIILSHALHLLGSHVYRLQNRPLIGATFDSVMVLVRLAAALVALFTQDLILFVAVYVALQLLVALPLIIMAYAPVQLQLPALSVIRQLLSSGLNLTVVGQSSWLVMYGDRLLLSVLSTSVAVAVYSASYQLALILTALGWPFLYFLLPQLGALWKAGDEVGIQQSVRASTRSMSLLIVPAVVGLSLIGSPLLEILADEQFVVGGLLVGMIALGVALEIMGTNMQYIFYVRNQPHILRRIYLRGTLLNMGLNLLAIPLFGYFGAGATTLLTFSYIFYALWRNTGIPFANLFDITTAGRCLLATVPMSLWVIVTVGPTLPALGLAVAGGALLYGAGLLVLGVISLAEARKLTARLWRRLRPTA